MFNQHELNQGFPQQQAPTSITNKSRSAESIFIVKSLLSAIIKDYLADSAETAMAISKLKKEIALLLGEDEISYSYFSYIDTQFYLMLSMLKGYHRLTILILNEKRHIDIAIGEAIKEQDSYQKLFRVYINILDGIESANYNVASNAIGELSKLLTALAFKV